MTHLTSENVDRIAIDCLPDEDEALYERIQLAFNAGEEMPEGLIAVSGIVSTFVFDEAKLEAHKDEILEMLADLPDEFLTETQGGGGGWSFLNGCMRRDGVQWTGFHRQQETLFCLGMGIGAVEEQLPRDMWSKLPGGVPYYTVTTAS